MILRFGGKIWSYGFGEKLDFAVLAGNTQFFLFWKENMILAVFAGNSFLRWWWKNSILRFWQKKLDFMAWAQFCGFSEKLDFEVEKLDSIVLAEKTQFCVFSRKYDFFFCFGGKTWYCGFDGNFFILLFWQKNTILPFGEKMIFCGFMKKINFQFW